MNASKKFFSFSVLSNLILSVIGFLILWLVLALTDFSIVGYIVCGVIFAIIAVTFNVLVVKKAKLKMKYSTVGIMVNLIILTVLTVLLTVLH